jgi:hypothetical protein
VPSDTWLSGKCATLESQYESAECWADDKREHKWDPVPAVHITAVHGLGDDDPTMAAALRQLAALA